jgi:hypothetical protein
MKWLRKVWDRWIRLAIQRGTLTQSEADQITWSVFNSPRRHRGGGGGGKGTGVATWISGLIVILFLAYIGMSLISTFQPTIGNLTYQGTGIGSTVFGLVQTWILPLALSGLLLVVVMHFLKR